MKNCISVKDDVAKKKKKKKYKARYLLCQCVDLMNFKKIFKVKSIKEARHIMRKVYGSVEKTNKIML